MRAAGESSGGSMEDGEAVKVGGSVWVNDGLRRRSFRCEVTGESERHWTIRCYGDAAKVPKARRERDAPGTRFAPQPDGLRLHVYFTDEALADHRWIEAHRAAVASAVLASGDAARLRRAAAAVGYDDGKRAVETSSEGLSVRNGDSQTDGGCLLCNRHAPDATGAVPPHPVSVVRGSGGAEVRICNLCAPELRAALAGVA